MARITIPAFFLFAATLGAQQPATPASNSALLPVDRIVAVVGDQPILWSDVLTAVAQRRAGGMQIPTDSAGQAQLARDVVNQLVDEEVLIQKAKTDTTIKVTDADVNAAVERQIKQVRSQFPSEAEFRTALRQAGLGTPEDYRRMQLDQARRSAYQERLIAKFKQDGKIVPVAVSEQDVTEAFNKNRAQLPKRPATVAFRQIIVAPRPTAENRELARVKAESLLAEIRRGGDFEQIAKRESMDPGSKEQGGDLGWNRRGQFVKAFDDWAFGLPPGQVSPVVETTFGFHIIRVDRVQPAEVKVRHILIRPRLDSSDVQRAKIRADSVLALWSTGAMPFDSLVARYHDPAEEKGSNEPFERAQLPESYQRAFEGQAADAYVTPFAIDDKRNNLQKYVVAHLLTVTPAGEYTMSDLRNRIRDQLSQERGIRRVIDGLRKATYVSIRIDEAPVAAASGVR